MAMTPMMAMMTMMAMVPMIAMAVTMAIIAMLAMKAMLASPPTLYRQMTGATYIYIKHVPPPAEGGEWLRP